MAEYFDVVNENGNPTGETVARNIAHDKGIRHRTAHIWITRENNGKLEVLMQKRSMNKDSFPGQYDTTSAGHIDAGEDVLTAAVRELQEELGIVANPNDFTPLGTFPICYAEVFHNSRFVDNEVAFLFLYQKLVDTDTLSLQPEEVDGVDWFDIEEVLQGIFTDGDDRFCPPIGSVIRIKEYFDKIKIERLAADLAAE